MIRKGTLLHVNPDKHAEYKKRHDEIFPDLVVALKEHGVHHYSIFLDEKRSLLFAYVEIESEARWASVAETEVCQRWWAFMKDVMPTNADNSPISEDLKSVFYLE